MIMKIIFIIIGIIALLVVGFFIGGTIVLTGLSLEYPVVGCLLAIENTGITSGNIIDNDSAKAYAERRCAEEFIDFSAELEVI